MAVTIRKVININGEDFNLELGCPFFVPRYESHPLECNFNVYINRWKMGTIQYRDGFWYAFNDFAPSERADPEALRLLGLIVEAADIQAMGEMIEREIA